MKIGIIGLGLIGGSMAKAYKARSTNEVYGFDTDRDTLSYALLSETIDGVLDDDILSECSLIIIALFPGEITKYLNEKAHLFSKDAIVLDTGGTKRAVCKVGFAKAKEYGFTFVGGHPMAGVQFSGIKYSRADIFKGASMIVVPPEKDIYLIDKIKSILAPCEFGKLSITTPEEHDKLISFTSQLAHVVSNAYVKSETAKKHHGFSAGSYKDMTRVATLNSEMWSELFLENNENLVCEIDRIINELEKYKSAIRNDNRQELIALLDEGCKCKKNIDG